MATLSTDKSPIQVGDHLLEIVVKNAIGATNRSSRHFGTPQRDVDEQGTCLRKRSAIAHQWRRWHSSGSGVRLRSQSLGGVGEKIPSLTMSAQSTTFCRALLHALVEERHFALVDSLRCPTSGSL